MTATPQPQSCLSVPGATVDFPDRKAPPMPTATTTNAVPLSQQLLAATDTIDATNTRLDVPVPAGADWADDAFDGAGAGRGRFFSHPNIAVDEVTLTQRCHFRDRCSVRPRRASAQAAQAQRRAVTSHAIDSVAGRGVRGPFLLAVGGRGRDCHGWPADRRGDGASR